jgi:hypothetical protein
MLTIKCNGLFVTDAIEMLLRSTRNCRSLAATSFPPRPERRGFSEVFWYETHTHVLRPRLSPLWAPVRHPRPGQTPSVRSAGAGALAGPPPAAHRHATGHGRSRQRLRAAAAHGRRRTTPPGGSLQAPPRASVLLPHSPKRRASHSEIPLVFQRLLAMRNSQHPTVSMLTCSSP